MPVGQLQTSSPAVYARRWRCSGCEGPAMAADDRVRTAVAVVTGAYVRFRCLQSRLNATNRAYPDNSPIALQRVCGQRLSLDNRWPRP
ncbi:hypothetical protein CBM2609_A140312 [Cupriavidus taiwanensis]|nr:hypothetical protein CBM2604_A120312 [Cupriavidus taiwanensis]SOZ25587.1 hypothetical protein CBM2609_A140312 [Cupriavidus taiwanensis]SOZ44837.1 hypothetical protein CBM2610_A150311 [Cupriavidus taiwanensis]